MVQVHDPVCIGGIEVCGGIIECDVSVLSYSDDPEVDDIASELLCELLDVLLHVTFAFHEMGCLGMNDVDEPLLEVLAEGSDMGLGKIHILVQMEHLDL